MSASDIIDTGMAMPRVASVRALSGAKVEVVWAAGNRSGRSEVIDLAPIIATYTVFRPLRSNDALFGTVKVIENGSVVAWDGNDLELTAEALEGLAEQAMTPSEFAAFMKRFDLTETAMAAILGYSRRQIGYFKTVGPIPRVVALACKGYAFEQLEKSGQWPQSPSLLPG